MMYTEVRKGHQLVVTVQQEGSGHWGMSRLWRKWMTVTHAYLTGKKVRVPVSVGNCGTVSEETRPINKQDVHEMFTNRWLGTDGSGTRLTWSLEDQDGMRSATAGERYHALRMHEEWACSEGISLFKPRGCEYSRLEAKQYE